MNGILAHRGPDDEGLYFAPGAALGHRRLSIIDIDGGHQPMTTADGRHTIVYNGEVYNFKRLRNTLQSHGHNFSTNSDTEVILKAFIQWGGDSFAKLQGMFALAIWDNHEKELHIARDHLGIKPLYYAQIGDELIFASEIKALLLHPGATRQIDPAVLATYLIYNNIFGDASIWDGVKSCRPGEHIVWRDGQLTKHRFFDISSLHVEPFKGTFDEAAEQYAALLKESVKDHLISDVAVGSYLSGGIDSSTVATLAAGEYGPNLPSFTGYFAGKENGWYDERNGAAAVAQKAGIPHNHCPITQEDFHTLFTKVSYHLDEPTLGSGAIPQYIVARLVKQQVKVVLTGHGGDEFFCGYPVFKSMLYRENPSPANLARLLARSTGPDEILRTLFFIAGGAKDPAMKRGQLRMFSQSKLASIITPAVNGLIAQSGGPGALLQSTQDFNSTADVDGSTRWYIATYLQTLLKQEDKVGMAHGLEARTPICYEPILRFALSLDSQTKIHNGSLKAIPRRAAQDILPPVIFTLPKRGFPTPIVPWLAGQLGHEWEAAWTATNIPSQLAPYLSIDGVKKEFHTFRRWAHRLPNAYQLAHRIVALQTLHSCVSSLSQTKPSSADDNADCENLYSKNTILKS